MTYIVNGLIPVKSLASGKSLWDELLKRLRDKLHIFGLLLDDGNIKLDTMAIVTKLSASKVAYYIIHRRSDYLTIRCRM